MYCSEGRNRDHPRFQSLARHAQYHIFLFRERSVILKSSHFEQGLAHVLRCALKYGTARDTMAAALAISVLCYDIPQPADFGGVPEHVYYRHFTRLSPA